MEKVMIGISIANLALSVVCFIGGEPVTGAMLFVTANIWIAAFNLLVILTERMKK